MEFDDTGYYEPEQAEIILDEFVGKMRDALTSKARDEIELLRRENAELKEANKNLRNKENAVKKWAKELEEKEKYLERDFLRKKFEDLLQPFLDNVEVFYASHEAHEQPKCGYCDDKRELLFTAANGQTALRNCGCSEKKYWYEPKKVPLRIVNLYKSNRDGREYVAAAEFNKDEYYSVKTMIVEPKALIKNYTDDVPEIAKSFNYYDHAVVFTSAEECQKYCDYLNQQKGEGE